MQFTLREVLRPSEDPEPGISVAVEFAMSVVALDLLAFGPWVGLALDRLVDG